VAGISVGSVTVDVVPDAERFVAEIASKIVPSAAKAGDEYAARFSEAAQIRLDAEHLSATIKVNADTADADAQLAATDAEADRVARTRDMKVDDHGSIGQVGTGLSGLLGILAVFGPALIPVGAAFVAAFAGALPALAAFAGGLGVVALAAKGVETALKGQLAPVLAHLQTVATKGLLPGVQSAVNDLLPLVPRLAGFIGGLASTMGTLASEAGKALTDPFWQRFFTFVGNTAGPILITMGHIVGDIATGFAGLAEAFKPVTLSLGAGIEGLAARFVAFGASASRNAGFRTFVDYVKTEGPVVVRTVGSIVGAIGHIVTALAPIGAVALRGIGVLADIVRHIPTRDIQALAVGLAGVTVAMKLLNPVIAAFNVLLDADPVVLIILALVGLVVGLVAVYDHSKTFRDYVANHVLPVLHEIWQFIQAKLVPVLKGILSDALSGARSAFDSVRQAIQRNKPQLMELVNAFKDVVKFIVEKVLPLLGPILKEAFRGIGLIIADNIKTIGFLVRAFNGMVSVGRAVGSFFSGPFVSFFTSAWGHVRSAFTSGLSFIRSIPDRIVAGLGDLGSLLIQAGENLISGLASGIVKGIGSHLLGALHSVASTITSHLPFSPAKMGPLRDFPPERSGQKIVELLAGGMVSAIPTVQAASERIAAGLAGLGVGVTVPTFTGSPLATSGAAALSYNGVNPAMFTAHAHDTPAGMIAPPTSGPAYFEGNLYLDSGEFLGVVRGEATAVVKSRAARVATTVRKASP
jgi:hypothetical protein